jgi:hypothetical protein
LLYTCGAAAFFFSHPSAAMFGVSSSIATLSSNRYNRAINVLQARYEAAVQRLSGCPHGRRRKRESLGSLGTVTLCLHPSGHSGSCQTGRIMSDGVTIRAQDGQLFKSVTHWISGEVIPPRVHPRLSFVYHGLFQTKPRKIKMQRDN